MQSSIMDEIKKISAHLARYDRRFDNIQDDLEIIDGKIDSLREEDICRAPDIKQAGEIEAINQQVAINKKKRANWQMNLRERFMLFLR